MAQQDTLHGLGRRKEAVAQVLLKPQATEEQRVNSIPFTEYFPTEALQLRAVAPLRLTSQQDQFGFQIKVQGGGKVAQAEAVQLAFARALLAADTGFRKQLKEAGFLTRDSRSKERKKPGLKGARRAPQFSKR